MDIKSVFGATLRRARNALEMTQEELAHDAGVGLRFIKDMEAGRKQPSITTLYKLCGTLGTTPEELLGPSWEAWQKENKG